MGTLTVTAAGFTGGPNGSKVYTISDADWANLISFMQTKFTSKIGPDTPNPVPLTPTQALLAWVNGWVCQTRDEIRSTQVQSAQQTAMDGVNVSPIVFG